MAKDERIFYVMKSRTDVACRVHYKKIAASKNT